METHKLTLTEGHITIVTYGMEFEELSKELAKQGAIIVHSYTEESKFKEVCYAKLAGLKPGQFLQV